LEPVGFYHFKKGIEELDNEGKEDCVNRGRDGNSLRLWRDSQENPWRKKEKEKCS
jgi:hypothetical protein